MKKRRSSKPSKKLTLSRLRKFVIAESKKLQKEGLSGKLEPTEKVKAAEYKPGGEAKTLEKDIDHAKALKIQERRLVKKLKKIRETQTRLKRKILKRL